MVLLDMVARLKLDLEVFYLDTDLLFPETYALRDEVERRYGIKPVAYRSQLTLRDQAAEHGPELWRTDPDRCCYLRKIAPNERALKGKKIALKEKIEESREFAADVQKAMSTGLSSKNSTMRDRGVRKAPFVVLIGANMPSILAEISFVSNPNDAPRILIPFFVRMEKRP